MATIAKTKQLVRMPRFGHRVDKTDPIMRGCVGWWPLNDGAGTKAKDISGGSHDGTYSGSPTFFSSVIGNAVSFPGTTGTILTCPQASDLGLTQDCSVSCWVKPDSVGTFRKLMTMWDTAVSNYGGFLLSLGDGGNPTYFAIFNASSFIRATSGYLPTTRWSHLAGTYDGITVRLYVDGAEVATASGTGNLREPNSDIHIGARTSTAENLDGDMQNARIYNRALSATEVSRLYSEPWAGLEPLSPFSFFSELSQVYAYYSAAFLQRL